MRKLLVLCLVAACTAPVYAQTTADTTAIVETALNYIEGWYEGNAARMEQSLHPDLAKRIVNTREGQSTLQHMGAEQLIQGTAKGYGKQTPQNEQRKDVTILDIYENVASVKVVARDWIDYLHVGKYNGEWKIINVLWEMTPDAKKRLAGR